MHEFHYAYRRDSRARVRVIQRALAIVAAATLAIMPWFSAVPARAVSDGTASSSIDAGPRVIIEEVAWAGSSKSIADEWIELANVGDATATVGGWQIRGAGESGRTIFLPPETLIGPRATLIVANYKEMDAKSALAAHVDVATTTVALSNSTLGVELRDASGMIIDRAGDGGMPFAGKSGSAPATMIRTSPTSTGDSKDGWMTATSSLGYKEGVADAGTPGFCDVCAMLADEDPLMSREDPAPPSNDVVVIVDESASSSSVEPGPMCTDAGTTTASDGTTTSTEEGTTIDVTQDVATSTTDAAADIVTSTSSDTSTTSDETASTSAATADASSDQNASSDANAASVSSSDATTQRLPTPEIITLNEIVSNPESGHEWIELALPEDATATDRELLLYDGQGKIATIAQGTPVSAPGYLVVTLASSKLNNSGDEVSLRETNGGIDERVVFGALDKGMSWAKDLGDADDVWRVTTILTPAAPNAFPAPVSTPVVTTISPIVTTTASSASTSTSKTKMTAAKTVTTKAKTTSSPSAKATGDTAKKAAPTSATSTKSTAAKTTATAKKTTTSTSKASTSTKSMTTKKTTTTKATAAISTLSFDDMFDDSLKNVRARVTGSVGSIAKLLGTSNAFILLNSDARGLIVYLPKYLHVPPYGSTVRVTGKLSATAKGPELRMGTDDVWVSLATSTPPEPRAVDLLMRSEEDAWSLTSAEGVLTAVNASSFTMDADDGTGITVSVPAVTAFRVKRLVKGDRVRVIGLADPRKATPTLLLRNADEVTILDHAKGTVTPPSTATATTPNRFPDWAPFGAAGGAIVATGAGKRLREILRQRKLRMLAKVSS